jgi:hypothetical protein
MVGTLMITVSPEARSRLRPIPAANPRTPAWVPTLTTQPDKPAAQDDRPYGLSYWPATMRTGLRQTTGFIFNR